MKRTLTVLAFALLAPAVHAHPGGHGAPFPGLEKNAQSPLPPAESAYGRPGGSSSISRTVSMVMEEDGRCAPDSVTVKQGEVVKIAARNAGKQMQEVAIGTAAELKEHADMLKKFPGMQASRANRASARGGQTVDLVWQFTRPGDFAIACAPVGQFVEKGTAKVTVTP